MLSEFVLNFVERKRGVSSVSNHIRKINILCFDRTARRHIERSQSSSSCNAPCRTSLNHPRGYLTTPDLNPLTTLSGELCNKAWIESCWNSFDQRRVGLYRISKRSSMMDLLTVPRTDTSFGLRRLSVAGPRIWNGLPHELRQCNTLPCFKSHLTFRHDPVLTQPETSRP